MNRWISCLFLLLSCFFAVVSGKEGSESENTFHYYCTVADERHFPQLINLIASIHKNDFDHLDEIAVFDLGLTEHQLTILSNIEKVKVAQIEKTHSDLLTHFPTDPNGRTVRGWYAWKPVIFKQGLDDYPYFIYLDAGSLLLNSPDHLFKHLKQKGYFLIHIAPHSIEERVTKPVVEKLIQQLPQPQASFVLSKQAYMIDAGFQGISRSVLDSYVLPMYRHSSDLDLFADDGSSKMGFGAGRHDQTVFSIYAHVNQMEMNEQGWSPLCVDGKRVLFHMHWHPGELNAQTCVYRSRGDYEYQGNKMEFVHWKRPIDLTKIY